MRKKSRRSCGIGGQAVLEGVMMKNKDRYAVSVRRPDGGIETDTEEYRGIWHDSAVKKLPFIRGVFNFVDSMVLGMRTLNWSVSFYEEEEEQQETEITYRNLTILPKSRRVYLDKKEVVLVNKEFELLLFLAENPNLVFSKDTLFDRVWGMDSLGDAATVTVHINRLRDKLGKIDTQNQFIETVWGAGYRFRID